MSAHVETSVPVATSPVATSAVMTLPIECDLDSASREACSSIGIRLRGVSTGGMTSLRLKPTEWELDPF
jgi:hypothetical protein